MIPSKQSYWILSYVYFAILWLSTSISYAQGLCDKNNWPPNSLEGTFKIDGDINAGCSPMTVKLQDLSGGTDIRYEFYYDGKLPAQLENIGNKDSINIYFTNTNTQVFSILQYGKKNGQDMYKCISVTVRKPPSMSYTQCNNFVTAFVPTQSLPNGYFLEYKLGTYPTESLGSSQLPFSATAKTVSYPTSISSYFISSTGQKICEKTQTINQVSSNPLSNSPFWGNISEIEMLTPTKLSLEFSGAFDPNGYDIFMHRKYSTFPTAPIKNVLPGKYEFDLPDSTNSYCFFVSRPDNCGGTEISSHLCTVPLLDILPLPTQNTLNWDFPPINLKNSPTPLNPIFGTLTVENTINIQEKGKPTLKETVGNTDITKTYTIDCKKDYCYQISSTSEGVLSYHTFKGVSKSLNRCVSRKNTQVPAITNIMVSVNENQEKHIKFQDNSGWNLNKEIYFLFENFNNQIQLRDSSVVITEFIDKEIQDISKCYLIGYRDQCGSNSKLSPNACSVQLVSIDDQELSWNKAIPFGMDSIASYEIIVYDENTNITSSLGSINKSISNSPLDLNGFETEAKYKLRILSTSGQESYSNILKIPIEAMFFTPDVFTPNSDRDNSTFQIMGRFGRVSRYQLEIFDRWGTKLVDILDFTNHWDGTIKGKQLPNGTYLYKLKIDLNNGEKHYKQGKIELLR